jgi:hypothetical protein
MNARCTASIVSAFAVKSKSCWVAAGSEGSRQGDREREGERESDQREDVKGPDLAAYTIESRPPALAPWRSGVTPAPPDRRR